MSFRFPNILITTRVPRVDRGGVYRPERNGTRPALIFCIECQVTFFSRELTDASSRLAYAAAEQIAGEHSRHLGHTIHTADPERLL